MARKWCHYLITRQAVNEILMDVNFKMSFRKGQAAAGNQTNMIVFVFFKQSEKNRKCINVSKNLSIVKNACLKKINN